MQANDLWLESCQHIKICGSSNDAVRAVFCRCAGRCLSENDAVAAARLLLAVDEPVAALAVLHSKEDAWLSAGILAAIVKLRGIERSVLLARSMSKEAAVVVRASFDDVLPFDEATTRVSDVVVRCSDAMSARAPTLHATLDELFN
jgi:hypothetical protein